MLPELNEIKEMRKRAGVTQRKLAEIVGVSQSIIAKIERGKVKPSYALVKLIITYLDTLQASNFGTLAPLASRPVLAVSGRDSIQKVIKLLQTTGFKQLPVKDNEIWVGCINERTISRHMIETNEPKKFVHKHVEQIMDEALPTTSEETLVKNVIPLLQQSQAVLVTKRGLVVGIVTNADLLKVIK
jgi:predicted transcriptional regulator